MRKISPPVLTLLGLLLGGAALAITGCAPAAPEVSGEENATLSRAEVSAFLINHFKAMGTPEGNTLGDLHPDGIFAWPGKRLRPGQVAVVAPTWRNDYKNTKMRVRRLIIEGNTFVVEYLYATTHIPTGKSQAVGTVAIGELRDGKLIFWKEYLDGRVSRTQAKDLLPVNDQEEPFPWPDTPESHVP